jgi:uncharacterized protein YbjT (DUF2867 family)
VPSRRGGLDDELEADFEAALAGVEVAYFLVHGMGEGNQDYARAEADAARLFADVAAEQHVSRIIYLGGVAPVSSPSVHLQSRLTVGEVLRAGKVPTLELRASMIVGAGSASWQIVRDLALRLPAMLLPSWTQSSTCPVAIDDVITALLGGLDVPLSESYKGIMPFLISDTLRTLLLLFFPGISLFLIPYLT